MTEQSFPEFVEALGSRTPCPGGGAASAMAATLGTSLLLMVVRFCRGKKSLAARQDDLDLVEGELSDQVAPLLHMAERDSAAYQRVSDAYRLPKDSPENAEVRSRAIQEAMVGAMVVPEETLCMVRDVLASVGGIMDCVGRAIAADAANGAHLLAAAAEGALLNVRINATYLEDRALAGASLDRVRAVQREIEEAAGSILGTTEKVLG